MRRIVEVGGAFDLPWTARIAKVGRVDGDGAWWWATIIDGRAATIVMRHDGSAVHAEAWGKGADRLLSRVPDLVGAHDTPSVSTDDRRAAALLARSSGVRLGSTGAVFETLVTAIVGQMVATSEARRSVRLLADAYGDPAPGPNSGLTAFPSPDTLAHLPYEVLHELGVERRRAQVIIEVARRSRRIEEAAATGPDELRRVLLSIRGIGPWTVESTIGPALGDKDAVPPGDFHLPNTIAWALAGEPRADDDRMFDLLEPYRPERRRVVVATKVAHVHAPRYGPKAPLRRHL